MAVGGHESDWGNKTFPDSEADHLSNLDESMSKMNELLELLWVQGACIDLKINVKKTKSIRIGMSKYEWDVG